MGKSSMDVKLIVASHKECPFPKDEMYFPVLLGSAFKAPVPGFASDAEGDSISEKNPVFCELTGLYWAWKNLDCDWLGLVHYRRYFAGEGFRLPVIRHKKAAPAEEDFSSVLTKDALEPLLKRYKILVPKRRHYYIESVYSHYSHTFDGSQLDEAREVISGRCPEYLGCFDAVMSRRSAYVFNMAILPKSLADEYCAWLFDILFALEKRVDLSGLTDFEKRYAGRVSERLFNVWLEKRLRDGALKRRDIHELPVVVLGKVDWGKKITGFLRAKFLGEKYRKSF